MRANDDLSALALTLDLDPEPLVVFDLRVDRRVQPTDPAVVQTVGAVGDAQRALAVSLHLDTILEKC